MSQDFIIEDDHITFDKIQQTQSIQTSQDDEQVCSICLDSLYHSEFTENIGQISNCKHFYHDCCIKEWSDRSNSCPTCRKLFYQIDILSQDENIIDTIKVQDRLLPNDAINNIPAEFIIHSNEEIFNNYLNNSLDQDEDFNMNLYSNCVLCDNQSSSSNMVVCDNCSGNFHNNCLGFSSNVQEWCCPMCNTNQELTSSRSGTARRRRRGRNLVDRNSRITNDFFTQSFRRSPIRRIGTTRRPNPRSRAMSIDLVPPPTPRVEPSAELSNEEVTAWEQFEKVKAVRDDLSNLEQSNIAFNSTSFGNTEIKKLKRPSRRNKSECEGINLSANSNLSINTSTIFNLNESTSSSSKPLITTLISEMRNNKSKKTKSYNKDFMNQPTNQLFGQLSPPISPTQQMATLSPVSSHSNSSSSSNLNLNATTELSFENKQIIQNHIRDKLRPLYQSNIINTDEYTNVNKSVSRKLYNLIQSENKLDLVASDNNDDLVRFVNEYVDYELHDL